MQTPVPQTLIKNTLIKNTKLDPCTSAHQCEKLRCSRLAMRGKQKSMQMPAPKTITIDTKLDPSTSAHQGEENEVLEAGVEVCLFV